MDAEVTKYKQFKIRLHKCPIVGDIFTTVNAVQLSWATLVVRYEVYLDQLQEYLTESLIQVRV